ncbi:MAG TPA: gliding motility-associated C-terminal domain-containing protein, partial [Fibrella sp.]
VTVCDSFTLPALSPNNTYYTATGGPGGTGSVITGGAVTQSQTIYIWAESGTCSDESNFVVTVNQTPVFTVTPDFMICSGAAGTISVTPGNFNPSNVTYSWTFNTAPYAGSTGTISVTQAGTYEVTVSNNGCTASASTVITVGSITADVLPDVTVCDSFTLPGLSLNNTYYTATGGPGGTGSVITAGAITQSQTVYIWAQSGTCTDESNFIVTVNQTPVLPVIQNVTACDSYTLPSLATGSYYSASGGPNGGGTPLTTVTGAGPHTVYVYAQTGTVPNCSSETSFVVTITDSPVVADMGDVTQCNSYTLPALTSGAYYTQSQGQGLISNYEIVETTTIYVYESNGQCSDEDSFVVTITDAPSFTLSGGCDDNKYVIEAVPASGSFGDNLTYQWSFTGAGQSIVSGGNTATATVSGPGEYILTVSVDGDTNCSTSGSIMVGSTACMIQKGISVNGDGHNDTFNLEGFNVSKLAIFNRYGSKVYERGNYVNEWFGQSDKGDELPDGTYYYVIDRTDGPSTTGWIYINRAD